MYQFGIAKAVCTNNLCSKGYPKLAEMIVMRKCGYQRTLCHNVNVMYKLYSPIVDQGVAAAVSLPEMFFKTLCSN